MTRRINKIPKNEKYTKTTTKEVTYEDNNQRGLAQDSFNLCISQSCYAI